MSRQLRRFFRQIKSRGGPRVTPYMFSGMFRKSWSLRYADIAPKGKCELPLEARSRSITLDSSLEINF